MTGMQHNENAVPFNARAVGAIPQFARVKYAATPVGGDPKAVYVDVCGAGEAAVGLALRETFAEGDAVAVRTFGEGTFPGIASAAIVAGVELDAAAGGKWVTTGTTGEFIALTAAAADDDYFTLVRKG